MTQMNLPNFLNRVRGLFNINGWLLEDALTHEQQVEFVRDPPRYFINLADAEQQRAIWRELQKRAQAWDTDE